MPFFSMTLQPSQPLQCFLRIANFREAGIGVMWKYDPAILQKIEFNSVLSEAWFKILTVTTQSDISECRGFDEVSPSSVQMAVEESDGFRP
jgi:hypothetical protein